MIEAVTWSLRLVGLGIVMIFAGIGLFGAIAAGVFGEEDGEEANALTALHKSAARDMMRKGAWTGFSEIDPDKEIASLTDLPHRN